MICHFLSSYTYIHRYTFIDAALTATWICDWLGNHVSHTPTQTQGHTPPQKNHFLYKNFCIHTSRNMLPDGGYFVSKDMRKQTWPTPQISATFYLPCTLFRSVEVLLRDQTDTEWCRSPAKIKIAPPPDDLLSSLVMIIIRFDEILQMHCQLAASRGQSFTHTFTFASLESLEAENTDWKPPSLIMWHDLNPRVFSFITDHSDLLHIGGEI